MDENRTIHLVEIPIGGRGGFTWNRLHGEREDICEAFPKVDGPSASERRKLLQARLRKIDDALDRLMSGSYGNCSRCGQSVDDTKLDNDPALALCLDCSGPDPGPEMSSDADVTLEDLKAFDTVVVRTHNSHYRILLLDPKSGRAMVEGGEFLTEPAEALIFGSATPGSALKNGKICVGCRMEMWVNERVLLTSPVESVQVKCEGAAESFEDISAALH